MVFTLLISKIKFKVVMTSKYRVPYGPLKLDVGGVVISICIGIYILRFNILR